MESRESGPKQRVYEQLGAPSLIYRNHGSYTAMDEKPSQTETPAAAAAAEYMARMALARAQARWYYPVDFHVVRSTLPPLPKRFFKEGRRERPSQSKRLKLMSKGTGSDAACDEEGGESDLDEVERKSRSLMYVSAVYQFHLTLRDSAYLEERSYGLQQVARSYMLLHGRDETKITVKRMARTTILDFQRYDANYVPAIIRYIWRKEDKRKTPHGLLDVTSARSACYDIERRNRADSAYMAPLHAESFFQTVLKDRDAQKRQGGAGRRRDQRSIADDESNGPNQAGNCILSFPCTCDFCREECHGSQCFLHPVGLLLDTVRLSFVRLPRGVVIADPSKKDLRKGFYQMKRYNTSTNVAVSQEFPGGCPNDLVVGDTILQLAQCGTDRFVARTALHCTVFTASPQKPQTIVKKTCWGLASVQAVHRIDFRSLCRQVPSHRPIYLACHPKYGRGWGSPKIAVLCQSDCKEKNIIYHVQAGSELHYTKHVIQNLEEISVIDFSSHHPMVLWASARSFVRPSPTVGKVNDHPLLGHGSSLYSIDLRCNKGTFQWSPSAENLAVEGIHSVSGVETDWANDHTLFASSVSAGTTWELDTLMPCRVVNEWSLPFACDDSGSTLKPTGFHGSGTLLTQLPKDDSKLRPILAVSKDPATYGLHLYQRPERGPRFQTRSIESTSCPGLTSFRGMSVAASSSYALPDVSDSVFISGLAAFRRPISSFLDDTDITRLGFVQEELSAVLCAVTYTNKGDLYAHCLLESKSSQRHGKPFNNLPIGCTAVPVPSIKKSMEQTSTAFQIHLTNQLPTPSNALLGPPPSQPAHALDVKNPQQRITKRKIAKENEAKLKRERSKRNKTSETDEVAPNMPVEETDLDLGPLHDVPQSVFGTFQVSQVKQGIQLPASMLETARGQAKKSRHEYDVKLRSVVENPSALKVPPRSDITMDLLDEASSMWSEDDEDSDEDDLKIESI